MDIQSKTFIEYSGSLYINIVESKLGELVQENIESINFEGKVDTLRELAVELFHFHSKVIYPSPNTDDIQPYFAGNYSIPEKKGFETFEFTRYSRLKLSDFQRLLLFAHKIVFEDALFHVLHDFRRVMESREEVAKEWKGAAQPAVINPNVFDQIRGHLLALAELKPLILGHILIPHFISTARVSNFVASTPNNARYVDENAWDLMNDALLKLSWQIQDNPEGNYGLSPSLIKILAADEDGESLYFEEEEEIADLKDIFYRVIVEKNYSLLNGDILDPIFMTQTEEFLYNYLMEAFGFDDPRKSSHSDFLRVAKLNSYTSLAKNNLPSSDIIAIRKNEEHFDNWRTIMKHALTIYYDDVSISEKEYRFRNEVWDEFERWKEKHNKELNKKKFQPYLSVGKGFGLAIASSLLFGEAFSIPSTLLGLAPDGLQFNSQIKKIRRGKITRNHFTYILE